MAKLSFKEPYFSFKQSTPSKLKLDFNDQKIIFGLYTPQKLFC